MSGKHDPRKQWISFSADRELVGMLDQYAATLEMTRTDLVVKLMRDEMHRLDVKLTPENQAKVDAAIQQEIASRRNAWEGYTHPLMKETKGKK